MNPPLHPGWEDVRDQLLARHLRSVGHPLAAYVIEALAAGKYVEVDVPGGDRIAHGTRHDQKELRFA